ncbi:MAG: hypothetical protein K9L32_13985 [Chromatiaceae bacterium]|nr:hypothetical protein [Chromatiaceae bacterium]
MLQKLRSYNLIKPCPCRAYVNLTTLKRVLNQASCARYRVLNHRKRAHASECAACALRACPQTCVAMRINAPKLSTLKQHKEIGPAQAVSKRMIMVDCDRSFYRVEPGDCKPVPVLAAKRDSRPVIEHGDAMLPVRIEPLAHNLITRSVMSRAEINGRQIPGPGNSSKFFGS